MQNIYIVEDPFSINYKNDWDTPDINPTSSFGRAETAGNTFRYAKPKLTITIEDACDDDEGFLADLDAMIAAQAKDNKDNIKDEKIDILGTAV